jgi:hypothetical protein
MAVICREHKLLFLANPRTGTQAIRQTLIESGIGEEIPPWSERGGKKRHHASQAQLIEWGALTDGEARSLTKFTGVRNPFDSIASHYQKMLNFARAGTLKPWVKQDRSKLARISFVASAPDFDAFVERFFGASKPRSMHAKYVDFADRFYRYEQIERGFREILAEAHVDPVPPLPKYNVTEGKRHYRTYYSDFSREVIGRVFAQDLERFGYEF